MRHFPGLFSGLTGDLLEGRNVDPMVLPGGSANIDRRLPERRDVWPGSAIKGVGQTFAEAGDRRRANADGLGARSDEWTVPKFLESGNLSPNYAVTR